MSQYFDAYTDAHSYLPEQACLIWIRTDDLEQLIHALGADPAEASEETWTDLIDEGSAEDVLAARYGDWTLLMEPFTHHGTSEQGPKRGPGGLQPPVDRQPRRRRLLRARG
ncbi:hypothetical protein [Nonomuraea sp. SYSU D8015]|uniref:hypothetical protein n=1 Tax=Nonomuraea sp. SYSU D8015 TaxID=2593644 RepID=UPI001660DF6E|nr:hypothetical protein [Nonomuraea sp. SYSU D8015]